jgi:hypothetical protein
MPSFPIGERVRLRGIAVVETHPSVRPDYRYPGPAIGDVGTILDHSPIRVGADAGAVWLLVKWDQLDFTTIVHPAHIVRP